MMVHSLVFVVFVLLAADKPEEINFEDTKAGGLPKGWSAAKTGEGPGSVWKVVEDDTSPHGKQVLAQSSSEGRIRCSTCACWRSRNSSIWILRSRPKQ